MVLYVNTRTAYFNLYRQLPVKFTCGLGECELANIEPDERIKAIEIASEAETMTWIGGESAFGIVSGAKEGHGATLAIRRVATRKPGGRKTHEELLGVCVAYIKFEDSTSGAGGRFVIEIGYFVDRKHRHKGVGSGAVRKLLATLGKSVSNSHTVCVAYVHERNTASTNLLLRCGFSHSASGGTDLRAGGMPVERYILRLV